MPTATDDPLPDLMRTLRSRGTAEKIRASKDLGRLGALARDAIPTLIALLRDDDAKVRETAAQAVGQMGVAAIPALSGMLAHPDKYVRRHAVWALGKLGPQAKTALAALCRGLKDEDPRTASGSAQALGNMGEDGFEAIPALTEAMRGTNIVLCRLAAKALSQIGIPAVPALVAHLQHTDPFVRGEAALAVGWIGPAAKQAVPYLVQLVRGKDARSLRDTPPPAGALAKASVNPAHTEPGESPTPIAAPVETSSPDDTSRVYAAQALGRIGPAAIAAVAELEWAARCGSESLRQAATAALNQIRPASAPHGG
jgi:HEAT repeat protein